jgi:polyisoprenoid-binding protein YceI
MTDASQIALALPSSSSPRGRAPLGGGASPARRRHAGTLGAFATALTVLAAAEVAAAAEMVLHLDPEATRVSFDLPATGHDVHGDVGGASGDLRFDPATGLASGEVVVVLGAAVTGSNSRDKTMHQEVLESVAFPTATLTAQAIEGPLAVPGDSTVTLVGTLKLHGADHPVRLPAKLHVEGEKLSGTATLEVPFKAWGMKDPSILFLRVADQVHVGLTIAGSLEQVPAPAEPVAEATPTAENHGR